MDDYETTCRRNYQPLLERAYRELRGEGGTKPDADHGR